MINYPNKKKKNNSSINVDSNSNSPLVKGSIKKGMILEEMLNRTNEYYVNKEIAFVYKKPTPIKINKVETKNSYGVKRHRIVDAYFSEKSTTDYSGLFEGRYIDFEVKQTKYKSFNVGANLHQHQIKHLENISKNGGYAYLIIYFYQFEKIFLINYLKIKHLIDEGQTLIKYEFFEKNAYVIPFGYMPELDYIQCIKDDILKGD